MEHNDSDKIVFEKDQKETIQMLLFIAGYNRGILSKNEHDLLDNWITKNDYNQYLFEMFTDTRYSIALQEIIKSQL